MPHPAAPSQRASHAAPPLLRAIRASTRRPMILVTMLALPHLCLAQASVGYRSGFTEGNGIAPRGHVDVDYGTSATATGSTRAYTVGEITGHVPVSSRFGLRVHLNSYTWIRTPVSHVAGHEQMGVGTALVIRDNAGWRPSTALLTRLDVPSGSLPTANGTWRPTVKVALAWGLPSGLTLASNLGMTSVSGGGASYTQHFGSLWLGRRIAGRVGSFAEAVTIDRESASGTATRYVRGGLTVLVTHAIHLDLNASAQLTHDAARRSIGIGVKHRI